MISEVIADYPKQRYRMIRLGGVPDMERNILMMKAYFFTMI